MKATVVFTWDEDNLGEAWFNEDNLDILLYTSECTFDDLLQFEWVEEKDSE